MDLAGAAWIRRERLERIATAERDRRAGHVAIAVAALGEASEWPARVVLALTKLPGDDCAEARRILENSLDGWAAEVGLEPLDAPCEAPEEAVLVDDDEPLEAVDVTEDLVPAEREAESEPWTASPESGLAASLAAPIAHDELERAFASAEAQVDEMHDVNRVAERVLLAEPTGLAELSGQALDAAEVPTQVEFDVAPRRTQAAFGASPKTRNERTRTRVLTTLERWLDNLERHRAGRMR